jgi:hypothetical protein
MLSPLPHKKNDKKTEVLPVLFFSQTQDQENQRNEWRSELWGWVMERSKQNPAWGDATGTLRPIRARVFIFSENLFVDNPFLLIYLT